MGAAGVDTLALAGAGLVLDLPGIPATRLRNIERIDLTGTGGNALVLTRLAVLNLSGTSNTLVVDGTAADSVRFDDRGWVPGPLGGIPGHRVWTNGQARVEVAASVGVSVPFDAVSLSEIALGNGGFVIRGQDIGDRAGISVASAGDVNGDGFADLIIGAPRAGAGAGRSYVVFGKADGFGAAIDLASIAAGTGGFAVNGRSGAMGSSVSTAGDLDGDGYGDLIIGVPETDVGSRQAYVVFGKAGGFGAALEVSDLAAGAGGFAIHRAQGGAGRSVSTAGDINGDGFDDLIIGAPVADIGTGRIFVVFGKGGGFDPTLALADIASGTGGFMLRGEAMNTRSGLSVSSARDVNGDGFDDLIIGAPDAPGGRSYVVFGKEGAFGASVDLAGVAAGIGGFVIVGNADLAGFSVSSAGDVNGDGFADLIIGAPTASGELGRSYVVFGKPGGFGAVIDVAALASGTGGFVVNGEGGLAGHSVSTAGDINGDGFDDLIIGAPNAGDAGRSYVVFGKAGGFGGIIELADVAAGKGGFAILGFDGSAGHAVSAAGDVNGDGFDDLIVGAPFARDRAGDAYVIFGRDFLGAGGHAGTVGDDVLVGIGGADVLLGGAGDDVIRVGDLGFRRVDGGSGVDTLALAGAGLVLDLPGIPATRLRNIERIDLTGTGGNALVLTRLAVLNLSGTSNTLVVDGTEADSVRFGDPGWVVAPVSGSPGRTAWTNGQARVEVATAVSQVAEPSTASIAAANAVLPEGGPGKVTHFTFTVTREGDTAAGLGLGWRVSPGPLRPAAPRDFVGGALPAGRVSFAPGATTATIAVAVAGDAVLAGHRNFVVSLDAAPGVALAVASAMGTILEDEPITDLVIVRSADGQPFAATPVFYTGPVALLEREVVVPLTAEHLNVAVGGPNWFIRTDAGNDAIVAFGGTNVLDGGAGSNFLSGAGGFDTFFVDARGASVPIWSTLNGFGPGDAATLWGVAEATHHLVWVPGQGAAGFEGLTLHAIPREAGAPVASLTLRGYGEGALGNGLTVLEGFDANSASAYIYVVAG